MSDSIKIYLLKEIAELESRIANAQRERDLLKRRLIRLDTAQELGSGKRSSVDRLVAEEVILDRIKYLGGSGQTARIFRGVQDVLPMLTYGTFRTYLHRMKLGGLIHQRERGRWRLGAGK